MLWSKDYQPAEGTDRIVATLESVLSRDPDHVGANHLYIHAVEASRHPQRAMEAAARLPGLAPSCGHLVHMPSHIYARVGDFESASTSNEAAVAADREYLAANPDMAAGMYAMMYYNHNMHFLAYAEAWQGNFAESKRWADELYAFASPHAGHMPGMEGFTTVPIAVLVRFRRWDDILSLPKPEESMPITTTLWHFARGMAQAGKGDIAAAAAERAALNDGISKLPPETMYAMLNPAANVLGVGQLMLDAKIAAAQKQYRESERLLREAVKLDDKLNYMEPPDWLLPPRETLGGILLLQGNSAEAEKVFREDLDRNPRSARSLFGLWQSLEAQGKPYDADLVHRQFDAVWKNADTKLIVADL